MGEPLVDQNQLEQIGNYVKSNMGQWMREQNIYPFPPPEPRLDREILERIVTVEQQLKFQNEKLEMMMGSMDKRFETMQESMDKRFESVDKRFEAVDKRFNRLYTFLTCIFLTMLAGFIPLIIKSM
ncbi:MAG: hypothetical protein PQJ50_17840 [Spirochaetales bacterium]|nr:hypothetical protein [Spirochaetales bacterium]